ncbi:MAG: DNA recombination protein RmuC [Candidatus Nanopelagicaceae bacterium]|jgi:DNA recombination protein RmuC
MSDSSIAIFIIISLVIGTAIGFLLGTSRIRSQSGARIASLEATNEAERANVLRLEAQLAARIEEEKSALSLTNAVKSVESKMAELARASHEAELKRVESETSIKTQIEGMRLGAESLLRETTKLAGALSNPQSRGKYGETQLEMLLESSGLQEGIHFFRQDHQVSDSGVGKPDIRIAIPGGSEIYIDSKFPFDKFLDAMGEEDPSTKEELMKAHAKDLLGHVNALAKRDYQGKGQSPDFVVLFAPFESILVEALIVDPQLHEKAFEKSVAIATPNTMLALLRTVAYVFNRSKLAQSASEIQGLAQELLKRIVKVHGRISTLGDRIKSTEKAFNELVASAEENMLRPARKISAIGGLTTEKMKALPDIDDGVREIKIREIEAGDDLLAIESEVDEDLEEEAT